MKLSEKSASSYKHVIIFGDPKSGKTRLLGTLASHFKILLFDLENGFETLLQLPTAQQENIDVITIPDTKSFPIAIETMLKVIRGAPVDICEEHGKVSCALCKKESKAFSRIALNDLGPEWIVGIDTLTQLVSSATAHITKAQPEDYRLQYEDWANLGRLIDTFLSHIQNAKFHVIVITHSTETEMEDGKTKLVPTAGTRNYSRNCAKFFGEVIYCEVKNRKHIAASSTTYANNILTGSRSGISLESSPEANLLAIFGISPPPSNTSSPANPGNSVGNNATAQEVHKGTSMSKLDALKARMAAGTKS